MVNLHLGDFPYRTIPASSYRAGTGGEGNLADSAIAHAGDFLKQAGTFAGTSRENLADSLKMPDMVNGSIRALRDVVTDCYSNN